MNLFLQLLGNGLVQGTVAVLYAAGFGFFYRSFRVFYITMGAQFVFSCYAFYLCATMLKLPLALAVCGTLALINHNVGVVRNLADYIYFLHAGGFRSRWCSCVRRGFTSWIDLAVFLSRPHLKVASSLIRIDSRRTVQREEWFKTTCISKRKEK